MEVFEKYRFLILNWNTLISFKSYCFTFYVFVLEIKHWNKFRYRSTKFKTSIKHLWGVSFKWQVLLQFDLSSPPCITFHTILECAEYTVHENNFYFHSTYIKENIICISLVCAPDIIMSYFSLKNILYRASIPITLKWNYCFLIKVCFLL